MEEDLSKFEFNNEILSDFDALMELHLDEIEDLTITSFCNNPKFYNIIGLCTNIKILTISGDLKINTNNIFSNIFKPELIETLILDGVRLPNVKAITKFSNLKKIVLKNIRYSSIKGFIGLISKEKVETLIFDNTDFCKAQVSIVKNFNNIKYLEIVNCINCKSDDFSFIAENRYLDKIILDPINIPFNQLSNFVKGKSDKFVKAQLGKTTKKYLVNNISIDENGIRIIINSSKLKDLSENLNFNKIETMILVLNKDADLVDYMKLLKRVHKEIIISVRDVSYLDANEAEMLKEQLNVKKVKIYDNYDDSSNYINDTYDIDTYIKIRQKINEFIKLVNSEDDNVLQKIIKVYKSIILSKKKEISDKNDEEKNQLTGIVENLYNDLNYAELFYNCLSCLQIECKTVKGEDFEGKTRYWNQVKIYDNWYNIDLYLDSKENINNSKFDKIPKYFLINDEEFYKTHIKKSDNCEECLFEIDKKLISTYFKTEENDNNVGFLANLINKIKQLFRFNKKSKKSLPAPENLISKEGFTNEEINILNEIDDIDKNF